MTRATCASFIDCARCGQCCRDGGPALHRDDLPLFQIDPRRPALEVSDLVVLRAGEPVRDQPDGERLALLEDDLLKIAGRGEGDWTCRFLSPGENDAPATCLRHAWRPLECRLQDCKAPGPLRERYRQDRLTRRDLVAHGSRLRELMDIHDARCGVPALAAAALAFRKGEADAGPVLAMLDRDAALREALVARGGGDAALFLLGRPLVRLLWLFGLAVESFPDGGARLRKSGPWRYPDSPLPIYPAPVSAAPPEIAS